jgi:hypothetical protein
LRSSWLASLDIVVSIDRAASENLICEGDA